MRPTETPLRPSARIPLAIALVSGCALAVQVMLTRVLAASAGY